MTHHIVPPRGAHNMERNSALAIMQGGEQMLYAMRLKSGLIKIGCSRDLAERRRALSGDILAFMPGDFDDELALHHSLSEHVHHGREWYYPTAQVMAAVNQMRSHFNLAPLAA